MTSPSQQWTAVAPLGPYFKLIDDSHLPFKLTSDIVLDKNPIWIQKQEWWNDRTKDFVNSSRYALISNYIGSSPADGTLDEKFLRAGTILWLARPCSINSHVIAHAKVNGSAIERHLWNTRPESWPHDSYHGSKLSNTDLTAAASLCNVLMDITEGAVWTAFKTLFMALQQSWWEGRFLMLWVGLESVYSSGAETSFKIALRSARLLKKNGGKCERLFRTVKKAYSVRSQIAHGKPAGKVAGKYSSHLMLHTEILLRDTIKKISLDPAVFTQIQSKNREDYLDSLCIK